MLNKPNRNDVDDGVQDIQNDVNRLADSLEDVLKLGKRCERRSRGCAT